MKKIINTHNKIVTMQKKSWFEYKLFIGIPLPRLQVLNFKQKIQVLVMPIFWTGNIFMQLYYFYVIDTF